MLRSCGCKRRAIVLERPFIRHGCSSLEVLLSCSRYLVFNPYRTKEILSTVRCFTCTRRRCSVAFSPFPRATPCHAKEKMTTSDPADWRPSQFGALVLTSCPQRRVRCPAPAPAPQELLQHSNYSVGEAVIDFCNAGCYSVDSHQLRRWHVAQHVTGGLVAAEDCISL